MRLNHPLACKIHGVIHAGLCPSDTEASETVRGTDGPRASAPPVPILRFPEDLDREAIRHFEAGFRAGIAACLVRGEKENETE
jgi:hypothetical protein